MNKILPNIKQINNNANANNPKTVINNSNISKELSTTPFMLPKDSELFLYNERNKENNLKDKEKLKKLKIYDKKTATTSTPLHLFKNFTQLPKNNISRNHSISDNNSDTSKKYSNNKYFSNKDQLLITEAIKIINDRELEKENQAYKEKKKETMQNAVEQRKEIFLVSMTTDIIKKEQKKLIKKIDDKEKALIFSNNVLENDQAKFKDYYEEKKVEAQKLMDLANKKNQIKTELAQNIKSIFQKLGNIKSENSKIKENTASLNQLRQFLDSLKNKNGEENENIEFYFKDPKQLIDIFLEMEEKNLFLIQMFQKAEQNLQEEKVKYYNLQIEKNNKIESLNSNIKKIKDNIFIAEQTNKKLTKKLEESTESQDYKKFQLIEDSLYKIISEFKPDMDRSLIGSISKNDLKNKNNLLKYLTELEKYINRQTKLIYKLDKKELTDKRTKVLNKNKNINNKNINYTTKESKRKKLIDKIERVNNKDINKKLRKDMFKSCVKNNNKIEEVKVDNNKDDDEIKEFFE